jgi:D-glycero-D-manno-heptose 1,7-bisphosphate phosphatase
LAYLKNKNYLVFIVTNQAGIAKGYFEESDFYILHKKIKTYLAKKNIYFNDVKYCPHHPNAIIRKYKKNTQYRKPGNLMLKEIVREWDIDIKKSIMIGDKATDELAARKSKIYFEYDLNNFYKQIKSFVKRTSLLVNRTTV